MKIAVVYGNDGSDVRVAKTCATLVQQGHDVHFVGWDRRPHVEKDSTLPGVTCHIVPHQVPTLGSTWSGQWVFTKHAVKTLRQIRPDVVHAVNEDNVIRIGWLKHSTFRNLVCDVFDSHLDKSTDRNWLIRTGVASVVNITRWWSDRLIATDDLRYEFFGSFRSKTAVIGNYPPDPGSALSRTIPTGPPKLFVSGTLSKVRGIQQVVEALELVPDLHVVAAGWAADEYSANEFLKHPRVEFLGHVTPAESLKIAADCDAILAMYAPTSRNHILASPNKIYDALSVGRPVIINSEAMVSKWVDEHETGFTCPYYDSKALGGYLATLVARRDGLPEFAPRVRKLFESGYSWEAMESRLAGLYAEFSKDAACEAESSDSTNQMRRAA